MKKNIIALLAVALALMAVMPVLAQPGLTIEATAKNTNVSSTSVTMNVTSNQTIVVNRTTQLGASFWTWKNQSGAKTTWNLSTTQNQTDAPFKNLTWRTFSNLADGTHEFIIEVTTNTTDGDPVNNASLGINITIDTISPSVTIGQPTSDKSFSPLSTGNLSIDINTTLSEERTSLSVCRVTIEKLDSPTATVINNQTFTCTATSITLNPSAYSGSMRVIVWANDSADNRASTLAPFNYRTIGVGGGGSTSSGGGGGGGSFNVPIGSVVGTPSSPVQTTSQKGNNNALIGIVIIGVLAYLVTRKKKRR